MPKGHPSLLTPEQSKTARGWLHWTQEALLAEAEVSLSTVRDFEKGRRVPVRHNLLAIRRALEQSGIVFAFGEDGSATGIAGPEKTKAGSPEGEPGQFS